MPVYGIKHGFIRQGKVVSSSALRAMVTFVIYNDPNRV